MLLGQFAFYDHVRPWGADVSRRTLVLTISSQQLHLNGSREILIHLHRLRGLTMKHQSAITKSPAGTSLDLITHKSVFGPESLVGVGFFKKEMPKCFLKLRIGLRVIAHLQQPIFDSESVAEVFTNGVVTYLGYPPIQVLAIEKGYPFPLALILLSPETRLQAQEQSKKESHQASLGILCDHEGY